MTEVRYVPLADTTPEKELDALAAVYKFILERRAKETTGIGGGADPRRKDSKHVSRTARVYDK